MPLNGVPHSPHSPHPPAGANLGKTAAGLDVAVYLTITLPNGGECTLDAQAHKTATGVNSEMIDAQAHMTATGVNSEMINRPI
jgi:hypothetical protein